MSGKGILQVVFGCVKGKVSNKQFVIHAILRCHVPEIPNSALRIIIEKYSHGDLAFTIGAVTDYGSGRR
ncbi:MAG: hypothetical protein ACLQVY_01035 [Limisphaerales bacterium]